MYETFFGLSRKPFNATPDPWFQYENRAYQEAYAMLLYGIQERKGFIALTGEVGTGKTTLLRRLLDNMNPAIKAVFVHNTTLTFDELVEFICSELSIPVNGMTRLARLQALNQFLIAEAKAGGTVVLLLDEAQNLSEEALENLRQLSNLETATDKLLQIVLAGQPELEDNLADPALRQLAQRIALRYRLDPLDDSEVEPYVDYRLRVVGRSRRDLFTDKAIGRLIPYAHGIPRLINVICDNALVLAYATDRKRVTGTMIDTVAADLRLPSSQPSMGRRSSLAPHSELEALHERWDPELTAGDGRRWALAGFAVGCAIALLGVAVVGLGHSFDFARHLSPLGGGESRPPAPDRATSAPAATTPAPGAPAPATPATSTPAANAPAPTPPASAAPAPAAPTATPSAAPAQPAPPEAAPAPAPVLATTGEAGASASPASSTERRSREVAAVARESGSIGKIDGRMMTIPRGGTVSAIASEYYGRYSSLALDLIQELNPNIRDLDVVAVGQTLWLPPLNADSLLRRQADGSYRLVVNAQPTPAAAAAVAQTIRENGYATRVVTREVASEQVLYRVEISGLPNRAAAVRAWETAKRLEWFDLKTQTSEAPSLPPRTGLSWRR